MRHSNKQDEELIVAALKRGETWAFDAIYDEYFDRIFQYCHQMLKIKIDAEDAVQEVFMNLWKNRTSIISEKSIRPFLYTSTRNMLLTRIQKKLSTPVFEDYLEYVNTPAHLPAKDLEYDEFLAAVNRCIDRLSERKARIVRYSIIDNLSNKEIARLLGINEQSVKNSLCSSMKTLREQLKTMLLTAGGLGFVPSLYRLIQSFITDSRILDLFS